MLELDEIIGTAGDDTLTGAASAIAYGLAGDDLMRAVVGADYQVLAGGTGDDLYLVPSGAVAVVSDAAGADVLDLAGLPFESDDSLAGTVDGRHLVATNEATGTTVYIIDWLSSSVGTYMLDDATLDRDAFAAELPTLDGYIGDLTWEQLAQQGLDVPTTQEANDLIALAAARGAELETPMIGQGLTVEQARLVALLFEAGLDREGQIKPEGLNFWIDRREDGLSELGLADRFLRSPEFELAFGDPYDRTDPRYLEDLELVEQLFLNVLNRPGQSDGLEFWTERLDSGRIDRPGLLLAFAKSGENLAQSPYVLDLQEVEPGVWDFVSDEPLL